LSSLEETKYDKTSEKSIRRVRVLWLGNLWETVSRCKLPAGRGKATILKTLQKLLKLKVHVYKFKLTHKRAQNDLKKEFNIKNFI
jgi:hypothetical protein